MKAPEHSPEPAEGALSSFTQLMSELRGGISPEEALLLRSLAMEVPVGCILEVGSFRGKSAVALAAGARASKFGTRPNIYCVEPHRPFVGFYGGLFGPDDRGAYFETMLRTGYYKDVALINASSEVIEPGWKEPIGLLFVDGDHRYSSVARDFRCWRDHLVDGGIVAFDDAVDPACGPFRLIEQLSSEGEFHEIAREGKIVALKKRGAIRNASSSQRKRKHCRILVACDHLVLTGGLLRMERMCSRLAEWGHEAAYLIFDKTQPGQFLSKLPILDYEQACRQSWDYVLVPGAGFPTATIEKFAALQDRAFGERVQLVLNDMSRRESMLQVNESLKPQVVIFNNRKWPEGSYTDFVGERFHILEGAVDTGRLRPPPYRALPQAEISLTIGGLANKNPLPLIDALRALPSSYRLRLYGPHSRDLEAYASDLITSGRLGLVGPLHEDGLKEFYDDIDIVCMTEENAGWSNLVAEAMACGLPVICTPHGTAAIARHGESAIVIGDPSAATLAEAITQLASNPQLCATLGRAARREAEKFDWDSYARRFLALIQQGGESHYFHSPEHGLYGKWPVSTRLDGLDELISDCKRCTILELGAAEGLVARTFLENEAALVHGFEINPSRASKANALLADWPSSRVRVSNLSDWPAFTLANADLLLERYDIVLYLGLHQHLPPEQRMHVFNGAVEKARKYIAIRTPESLMHSDRLSGHLKSLGFAPVEIESSIGSSSFNLGPLLVGRRIDCGC